jgi:hypothetical protein
MFFNCHVILISEPTKLLSVLFANGKERLCYATAFHECCAGCSTSQSHCRRKHFLLRGVLSNPSMVTGVMRVVCLGLHVAEMLNFSAFRDSIAGKSIASVCQVCSPPIVSKGFSWRLIPSQGFPKKGKYLVRGNSFRRRVRTFRGKSHPLCCRQSER